MDQLPVGVESFRKLREGGYYYCDKTMLIADFLESKAKVTLITRPRRFGKTLIMNMVKEFFDIDAESEAIFSGLAIMDTQWVEQMNTRPVIFFSFRHCKGDIATLIYMTKRELLREYSRFKDTAAGLPPMHKAVYDQIVGSLIAGDENVVPVDHAIAFLSEAVSRQYGKNPIVLIDEYDTPLVSAYMEGCYRGVWPFFSALYSTALEDNPYLYRALLIGGQCIAKLLGFSNLSSLMVDTVGSSLYDQYFGFTELEASSLLQAYGLQLDADVISMYGGYRFGKKRILDPLSILKYANSGELRPYWVCSSTDALVRSCILEAGDDLFMDSFDKLIVEGSVTVPVTLDTLFFEILQSNSLWGLLINAGFIALDSAPAPLFGCCQLRIPNDEVRRQFHAIVAKRTKLGDNLLNEMFFYLIRERDAEQFAKVYKQIVLNATSFHDAKENAYHMLMLGMCVYLSGAYEITSNLEAGLGRSDITLKAKEPDRLHIIMEFKQGDDLGKLAGEALEQIKTKQYAAGLAGEVLLMGIAHRKKECEIRTEIIRK